jgi:hypothetical protein
MEALLYIFACPEYARRVTGSPVDAVCPAMKTWVPLRGEGGVMAGVDPIALAWRKSLACEETNCVEVATACGRVMVRDSKSSGGIMLAFPAKDWITFVSYVRENNVRACPLDIWNGAWP